MKILLVHNFYREPGGEDAVFAQEKRLLERKGHHVITYTRSNEEAVKGLRLLKTIVSAQDSRNAVEQLLDVEKPEVVHIHNTFMMISPSIYEPCLRRGIPTVQTIHNYRLVCPAAYLFRDGKVCEECIDHGLIRGVRHGCYRNSRMTTAAVATMLAVHRNRRTWKEKVTAYISLTEFAKHKLVSSGLPSKRVHVKPNFLEVDPGERSTSGDYALFVGRLSLEKGVDALLKAWELLRVPIPLKIAGDGPARPELEAYSKSRTLREVEYLGRLEKTQTRDAMKRARFVLVPSLWYEACPLVILEAFACGTPVLASRLGSMEELVDNDETGLHFAPGSAADLARIVEWAWTHPAEMTVMGHKARRKYETTYQPEANYESLMQIYTKAINETTN